MTICVIPARANSKRIKNKNIINFFGKPLIYYIMKHYAKYGFKEFYIALGYKGEVIKKYFKKNLFDWKIHLIDTGLKTMTGGRLKKLTKFIDDKTFMLTYGDGLSNINLKDLLKFHNKNKKMISLTAVRPPARFGAIKIKNNKVNRCWFSNCFSVLGVGELTFGNTRQATRRSTRHPL